MSTVRFFKKEGTKTKVQLSNGFWLPFEKVDNSTAIVGTDDPNVLAGIDRAIQMGRGGLTEISAEEFAELRKKKETTPLKKAWREEFSPKGAAAAMAASRAVPLELGGQVSSAAEVKPNQTPTVVADQRPSVKR